MNRFFPFISCAFVGILVSSCAQNPHCMAPKPTYGSASGTPHRSAKHRHVALAQVPLRHPRAASEGHRRLLRPWNHLPAAPETPGLRMPRRPPIRITSRQPPRPQRPRKASRSGHPIIGAGKSDPSSKVTSNIRTKLTEPRTSTSASTASDLARTMYPSNRQSIAVSARRRQLISGLRPLAAVSQAAAF
jgi:hypothetical protein